MFKKIKKLLGIGLFYVICFTAFFALGIHLVWLLIWKFMTVTVDFLGLLCGTIYIAFLGFASVINKEWADKKLEQAIRWTESNEE